MFASPNIGTKVLKRVLFNFFLKYFDSAHWTYVAKKFPKIPIALFFQNPSSGYGTYSIKVSEQS